MIWIISNLFHIILSIIIVSLSWKLWRTLTTKLRARRIKEYAFPGTLKRKVAQRYPHLDETQLALVIDGLRDYFQICNIAGRKPVAMPSQVVDLAWHEFILFTRKYQEFCRSAFGRFLHHTPAEAMSSPTTAAEGIKRAWRIACARETISPLTPAQLPLLFAIDAQLNIEDGFFYLPNCEMPLTDAHKKTPADTTPYCASHIGCTSGCAGDGGCSGSCSSGGCGGD
ncbi:MAG: hypothetical protein LRY66_11760 [Saccharospirillaceae bacterium]|nr:hypothetical protein [Saccharospirillaceae bacterium]MCD8531994.1 hypothetical protein [Saccharospirillaceae bacterium]